VASPSQRPSFVETYRALLIQLGDVTAGSLIRASDLGEAWKFEQVRAEFESLVRVIQQLRGVDPHQLPLTQLENVVGILNDVRGYFEKVATFDSAQSDARTKHKELLEAAPYFDGRLFDLAAPVLAYAARDLTPLNTAQGEFESVLAVAKTKAQEIALLERRLSLAVAGAEQTSAGTAVSEEQRHFEAQAQEHQKAGIRWLWAIIAISIAIVAAAGFSIIISLDPSAPDPASGRNIQLALAKLVVASVLFSGLVTASRTYRAHRHNYVVNKHRLNALKTFRSFVAAAGGDDTIKNTILLQTTSCIFTPQPSGFGAGKDAETSMPTIAEIGRAIVERK
jgi:hypothetical protein